MQKLCLCLNIPSRYREEIYSRIDATYDCEWFFENTDENIKMFDILRLNKVGMLKTRKLGGFYWTKGLLGLLRKEFDTFIMIGATRCLSREIDEQWNPDFQINVIETVMNNINR